MTSSIQMQTQRGYHSKSNSPYFVKNDSKWFQNEIIIHIPSGDICDLRGFIKVDFDH